MAAQSAADRQNCTAIPYIISIVSPYSKIPLDLILKNPHDSSNGDFFYVQFPMRLSLRTLLAFEDNVFDVEQHRRLEQILPTDPNAEFVLGRIRSVVRNAKLGVPGLVDHQEELNPNYVAEYLDHQMPADIQEQFEAYCLSADKFLAEIASVHHILANVLGEPARTSRECRLKCYSISPSGSISSTVDNSNGTYPSFVPPKHFQPLDSFSPDSTTGGKSSRSQIWNLFFRKKSPQKPEKTVVTEQKNTFWSFAKIGLLVAALLLGWQQIEKQRTTQTLRNVSDSIGIQGESVLSDGIVPENAAPDNTASDNVDLAAAGMIPVEPVSADEEPPIAAPAIAESLTAAVPKTNRPEPIEQTSFTTQAIAPAVVPAEDPFSGTAALPADTLPIAGWADADPFLAETADTAKKSAEEPAADLPKEHYKAKTPAPKTAQKSISKSAAEPEYSDAIIAFQPIAAKHQADQLLAKGPIERPVRSMTRSPLPDSAWQSKEPEKIAVSVPDLQNPIPLNSTPPSPMPPSGIHPASPPLQQHMFPIHTPEIVPAVRQTSGTRPAPRILGRAMPSLQSYPNVMFSAISSNSPWQLIPLPFDLNGDQYLLTATPFRGSFELASGYRIEMIGDTKLCILPLDSSGTPGIFVDYGRIIIKPLLPNRSLRIETEKSRGMVSTAGTESVLFIDTFAELSDPPNTTKPAEGQKPKTGPILGFVPKQGEQIVWKSIAQPQPFVVNSQGSLLLQSDQYRFGEIRMLPNWLGTLPMPEEDRLLADLCQRVFSETGGNGEQALTHLMQDTNPSVRILGLRLWGDLGNFDVPLTLMAEKRKEDEAVRQVLVLYFQEVMRRDSETVQRFADAIQIVREARKN